MIDTADTGWKITFRRITKADIPNLVRWQSEPEVSMWYWDLQNESKETLIQRWAEKVTSSGDTTDRYIVDVDGHEIGEIQDYVIENNSGYATKIGISRIAGVDILIGESEWRNIGVGTAVLRVFVREIVFNRSGIETCVIDPHPDNLRAIRTYEKVGFRHVKTYHSSEDNVDVFLMKMDKPIPTD